MISVASKVHSAVESHCALLSAADSISHDGASNDYQTCATYGVRSVKGKMLRYSLRNFLARHYFAALILFAAALGATLRLFQFGMQLIGDDEWHAINIAVDFSFKHVLTHFHEADNCIPLTAFYKILLETTGLDEFGLRFLQIITGIALLILFPVITKSIFKKKVIILFAFLLAISPFLIHYSRFARPYGIVVLLSFISIFSFYLWLKRRKPVYAIGYVACAILAPYFQLFSLPAVIAPLLYVFLLAILGKPVARDSNGPNTPALKSLFVIGVIVLVGISLWFIPTLDSVYFLTEKANQGVISFDTVMGFLGVFGGSSWQGVFGGSSWQIVSIALFFIFLTGLYTLGRTDRFLLGFFLSVISCQLLAVSAIRPSLVQEAVVFARYSISCLPVYLLIIALGLSEISKKIDLLISKRHARSALISNSITAILLLITFLSGPIIDTYRTPNNFANHYRFQRYYDNRHAKMKAIPSDVFPQFYVRLKEEDKEVTIIEFPFFVPWAHAHQYVVYQRFHGKRVKIGHTDHSYSIPNRIMHENIKFRNFVNLEDLEDLRKSKCTYVVLHKDMLRENVLIWTFGTLREDNRSRLLCERREKRFPEYDVARRQAEELIGKFENSYGEAFFEDKWIAVFKIR